jgi:hypothetical protein
MDWWLMNDDWMNGGNEEVKDVIDTFSMPCHHRHVHHLTNRGSQIHRHDYHCFIDILNETCVRCDRSIIPQWHDILTKSLHHITLATLDIFLNILL